MIKDIVVNLDIGERASPATDYAISVAAAFDAHLAGVAFLYDPVVPDSTTGYVPPEVIEAQQRDNAAAARAVAERFTAASARAGVAAETLTVSASAAAAGGEFARIARRFDLSIVEQAEPGKNNIDEAIIEAALFDSGRPIVVVPYVHKAPLKLDRVMVAWDGSRAAARAIGDAMPFLRRAQAVEVVIVASGSAREDEIEGADIGQHLSRHGLQVEVRRTVAADLEVGEVLLSLVADAGTDLIVMGGYGHSRLREFVLGGATRGILRAMTAPVLMSH